MGHRNADAALAQLGDGMFGVVAQVLLQVVVAFVVGILCHNNCADDGGPQLDAEADRVPPDVVAQRRLRMVAVGVGIPAQNSPSRGSAATAAEVAHSLQKFGQILKRTP